jgi:hypothetical protein
MKLQPINQLSIIAGDQNRPATPHPRWGEPLATFHGGPREPHPAAGDQNAPAAPPGPGNVQFIGPLLPDLISRHELARRLKKSLRTINYWQRRGILPYVKCGPFTSNGPMLKPISTKISAPALLLQQRNGQQF